MKRKKKNAFTLIEVLLAVALGALIMTYVSQWIVSMGIIWIEKDDNRFFEQHCEGVGTFLNMALARSETPEDGADTSNGNSTPVAWAKPPNFDEQDDPLISFRLEEPPALFAVGETTLPGISGYLVFGDRALQILWHSRLQEIEEDDEVNLTTVSPYLVKTEYAYWIADDDGDPADGEWEISEEPETDEDDSSAYMLPNFIRLTFRNDDGEEHVETVFVPQSSPSAPIF